MSKEIAILLPYKEKFTNKDAGAASIWVKDYLKKSKLSNKTIVYGNLTKSEKPITNNFKNINTSQFFLKEGPLAVLPFSKNQFSHLMVQRRLYAHTRPHRCHQC